MRTDRILRALRHPITEYRVQKAKRIYRQKHPLCELCAGSAAFLGRTNDVHHKVPVHVDASLACDPTNLVTLCKTHHRWVGHWNNWQHWNRDVDWTIGRLRAEMQKFMAMPGIVGKEKE